MSILSAGYRAVTLAVPCVVIPGGTMGMTLDELEQRTNEVFDGRPDEAMEIHAGESEARTVGVFAGLRAEAVDGLDNVAFVVEDRPKGGSLGLLGLYEGHDRFARAEYGYGQLPDVIVFYCAPILAICDSAEQVRSQVYITLLHEIGHYYG